MNLKEGMRGLGTAVVDILFPRVCEHCFRPMEHGQCGYLCSLCLSQIRRIPDSACQGCAKIFSDDFSHSDRPFCAQCQRIERTFDRCYGAAVYEGIIKKLIHSFKFSHAEYLSSTLQNLLTSFLERDSRMDWKKIDFIIPVPLHPQKHKERGYNQSEILAKALHQKKKIPCGSRILIRRKYSEGQTLQDKKERWENIRGSFELKTGCDLQGKYILLVDDVMTTGATAGECAKVLKLGGAKRVDVLVLARSI